MALAQNDLSSAVSRRLGTNPNNYRVDPSSYDQQRGQITQQSNDEEARQREAIQSRLASQGMGDSGLNDAQDRQLDYNTRMGAASQLNSVDNNQFDKEFLAQQSELERNQNNDQFTKGLAQSGQIANRGMDIQQAGQEGQLGIQQKGLEQSGQLGNRSLDVQQQGQAQSGQIANRGLDIQDKSVTGNLGIAEKGLAQSGQIANRGLDLEQAGQAQSGQIANRGLDLQQAGQTQQGQIANRGLDIQQQGLEQAASEAAQKLGYDYASLGQQDKEFFQQQAQQQGQFNVSSGQTQQQINQAAAEAAQKMGYDYASLSQQDREFFQQQAQSGQIANRGMDIQQQGQQNQYALGNRNADISQQATNQQGEYQEGQLGIQQQGLIQQGQIANRGMDIQVDDFQKNADNQTALAKLQGDISANLYGIQHGYTQGDATNNAEALSYYDKALSGQTIPDGELNDLRTSNPTAYWSYQDGMAGKQLDVQAASASDGGNTGWKGVLSEPISGIKSIAAGNPVTGAKQILYAPVDAAKKAWDSVTGIF